MADPQPPDGPAPIQRSFAQILSNRQQPSAPMIKAGSSYKGEPAIFFSKDEIHHLSSPLQRALIGKFSRGRPSMDVLRKEFQTIGFKGSFNLGLMDYRHILIRFDLDEDYHRCWMKSIWNFGKFSMRVLKWTPSFSVEHEPSIVPVWVSLEHLPLYLFGNGTLFSIAALLGRPLKIDSATQSLSRPSVARFCVELDLLKPLPSRIWIGEEPAGFWQKVSYENLPEYCLICHKLGHNRSMCKHDKDNAAAHKPPAIAPPNSKPSSGPEQVWKPKEIPAAPSSSGLTAQQKDIVPILVQSQPVLQQQVKELSAQTQILLQSPPAVNHQQQDQPSPGTTPEQQKESSAQPIFLLQSPEINPLQQEPLPVLVLQDTATTIAPSSSGITTQQMEDVLIITEIVVQQPVAQQPADALLDSCQPLHDEEKQKDNVQALDLDATKNNEHGSSRDFGLHVALIMDVDPMVVSKDVNEKIPIQDTCQPLQEEELLSESPLNKSDHPQISSAQPQIAQGKNKQSFTSGLTLREKELIARMPDRPWQPLTRVVLSTEKKQTSKIENLLQEPQQMLSFKLPETSQDNDMSETEASIDDHFDQDDFIPVISKKKKGRNKKDYSSSIKTVHTRQDSRR